MPTPTGHSVREASRLFHALSDPTRLRILEELRSGEQCVCELTESFDTSQSRLSFHLRVLKEAGLISDRPEGRWMYYSLNREALKDVVSFMSTLQERSASNPPSSLCR